MLRSLIGKIFKITNYELQITNYKLQITNYKLQIIKEFNTEFHFSHDVIPLSF